MHYLLLLMSCVENKVIHFHLHSLDGASLSHTICYDDENYFVVDLDAYTYRRLELLYWKQQTE